MPDFWLDVDANVTVPVNLLPLLDDTDFKTIEQDIVYNQAGMDLVWHFVTSAGVITATAVTPTTGGNYDWAEDVANKGTYKIEIPASGGASINNDTEGYGWFTGICTGVLPWRGPTIGFRAAGLNDKFCDSAYDATRGLAGTALPAAAADAAGGLPISDAGGLDLDNNVANQLVAIKLDHLVAVADADDAVDNSIVAKLAATGGDWSTFTSANHALQAIRARGDAAWITAVGFPTAVKLLKYVQLLARSDAAITTDNAAELTEINADGGSGIGDFANQTDADEAIRDRGDAAWVTGTGTSTLVAQDVRDAMKLAPTAGAPAGGSVDTHLDDILTDTADMQPKLGTPVNLGSGATLADNLTDVEGQTDDIGIAGAGLTALGDVRLANLDATVSSRSVYAGGAVASVTGDVAGNVNGKVLGGGAGVIAGTGARVVDAAGNNVAPAATALTSAMWTNARAGYLDELAAVNLPADVAAVLAAIGALPAPLTAALTRAAIGLAAADLDAQLAAILAAAGGDPWAIAVPGAYAAGTAGYKLGNLTNYAGPGITPWPVTINMAAAPHLPLAHCLVQMTTDAAGLNVVAGPLLTNALGVVQPVFMLHSGTTYYMWCERDGYTFTTNPTVVTVP